MMRMKLFTMYLRALLVGVLDIYLHGGGRLKESCDPWNEICVSRVFVGAMMGFDLVVISL